MDVNALLRAAVEMDASDVHLCVPGSPIARVRGELVPLDKETDLTPEDTQSAFEAVVGEKERPEFHANKELDFGYGIRGIARFRVNAYLQRGTIALAFRVLPFRIPTIEQLGLPPVCQELVMKPHGLVLVTGPTGSGKSSTLAAMINYLNDNAAKRIITIEDPIEYLYPNKKCSIVQREVGKDTNSLRYHQKVWKQLAAASTLSVDKEEREGGTHRRHGKANHKWRSTVNYCLGQPGRMGAEEGARIHPVSLRGGGHGATWPCEVRTTSSRRQPAGL